MEYRLICGERRQSANDDSIFFSCVINTQRAKQFMAIARGVQELRRKDADVGRATLVWFNSPVQFFTLPLAISDVLNKKIDDSEWNFISIDPTIDLGENRIRLAESFATIAQTGSVIWYGCHTGRWLESAKLHEYIVEKIANETLTSEDIEDCSDLVRDL